MTRDTDNSAMIERERYLDNSINRMFVIVTLVYFVVGVSTMAVIAIIRALADPSQIPTIILYSLVGVVAWVGVCLILGALTVALARVLMSVLAKHRVIRIPGHACKRCGHNLYGLNATSCPLCGGEINDPRA